MSYIVNSIFEEETRFQFQRHTRVGQHAQDYKDVFHVPL